MKYRSNFSYGLYAFVIALIAMLFFPSLKNIFWRGFSTLEYGIQEFALAPTDSRLDALDKNRELQRQVAKLQAELVAKDRFTNKLDSDGNNQPDDQGALEVDLDPLDASNESQVLNNLRQEKITIHPIARLQIVAVPMSINPASLNYLGKMQLEDPSLQEFAEENLMIGSHGFIYGFVVEIDRVDINWQLLGNRSFNSPLLEDEYIQPYNEANFIYSIELPNTQTPPPALFYEDTQFVVGLKVGSKMIDSATTKYFYALPFKPNLYERVNLYSLLNQ